MNIPDNLSIDDTRLLAASTAQEFSSKINKLKAAYPDHVIIIDWNPSKEGCMGYAAALYLCTKVMVEI